MLSGRLVMVVLSVYKPASIFTTMGLHEAKARASARLAGSAWLPTPVPVGLTYITLHSPELGLLTVTVALAVLEQPPASVAVTE